MRRSLAKFSESEASNHTPSLADFPTTTPELKFSVHRRKAIETATVGREGVFGAMSGFGLYVSLVRTIVQLPMFASRIASTELRKAVATSEPIADLCLRYNEVLLAQARVTAACNALHQVEARFCRWLLQTRDRAESDSIPLTQEFLAEMLGVRRTSVTEVASKALFVVTSMK